MWNVHRMSVKIEHRNLETWKTREDFLVQVRNFLLPLSLKVLRHKEREAQSFYSGFFICTPPIMCGTRHKGLREQAKTNRLPPRQASSQLYWLFQNLPKSSARSRYVTSFALATLRFPSGLLWHLWVTRPLRPRTPNTCVNVEPK